MNEQLTFWSMIMMNSFFILAFLVHVYRTIKLDKPILDRNIAMYLAIIILAFIYNLIILDKLSKELIGYLSFSIISFFVGTLTNFFTKKSPIDK